MPPTPGSTRWAPRPAAVGSSPRPACPPLRGRGPPQRRRRRRRRARPARGQARGAVGHGQAQRGRVRLGQRARRPRGPAGGPGAADPVTTRAACPRHRRVRGMQLEDEQVDIDAYLRRLEERGGIVEERVVGDEVRSPSVQLRVTPLGELEILSTHDQILGGPTGQSYLGARFPADPAYATTITSGGGEGRSGARRQGGPRAFRPRLRRRPARGPTGRRTPSRSTCAGAARRIRS